MDEAEENAQKEALKPYLKAEKEIRKMIKDYFAQYAEADEEKRKQMEDGQITKEEYKSWRMQTICSGKKYEAFRDKLAKKYVSLDQESVKAINKAKDEAFITGANYNLCILEKRINGRLD